VELVELVESESAVDEGGLAGVYRYKTMLSYKTIPKTIVLYQKSYKTRSFNPISTVGAIYVGRTRTACAVHRDLSLPACLRSS
jgi:hypothetical protein